MLSFCRTPDSPVNLSSVQADKAWASTWESASLCASRVVSFFSFKEGEPARMKVWRCARTGSGISACLCGRCATSLPPVCLSLSLIRCLSLLQSSPQNRPLIIVWCVSGSAVRSYKQRLDVFIADTEREAGAPLEGWWRQITEARIETFSAGHEATGAAHRLLSPPPFSSAPHGSSVWSGSALAWLALGWAGWWSRDMTLRYPAMKCIHEDIQAHYIYKLCILSYCVSMESHY